jgi:hypothetical protein
MNEITICSIVPYLRHWERSYGHFRIQPGSVQNPTYMVVGDAKDKYWTDLEKGQFIMVTVDARNIVNDFLTAKELDQGFFACEGDEPTEKEMNTAIARQREFYVKLVRQGDSAWAKFGKHEHISDAQRRAAFSLGVQKDWNTIARANLECPSCGEMVPVHVAMCKHCSAIINREAYDKLDFAGAPAAPSQAAAPKAYEDLSEGKEA